MHDGTSKDTARGGEAGEPGRVRRHPGDAVHGRAVVRAGDRARPRRARPERVGVRAVQRAHRPARQPRRGRSARPARHLPQLGLRDPARCRTPRRATATPSPGQTVINVTNGKLIRLLVDDEPLDVRYGTLHSHERVLDMRAGTLTREMTWTSPADDTVRVRSTRLVSLTQRAVAAICYEVEPVGKRAAARRPVRAGRQRVAAPAGQGPARRRRPGVAAGLRGARGPPGRRGHGAPHPGERPARRRRHGPRDREPRPRPRSRWRAATTWAGSPSPACCGRGSGCGW